MAGWSLHSGYSRIAPKDLKLGYVHTGTHSSSYASYVRIGYTLPPVPRRLIPTFSPASSGTWKLVAVDAEASAVKGLSEKPPYLYKGSVSLTSCQKACLENGLCIGLTFLGRYRQCKLWLVQNARRAPSGWYSSSGTEGLLPKDLKPGHPQRAMYHIVTYARSGHRPSVASAAPVTAGNFKKLGNDIFVSVWAGSNRLPVYRYKTGVASAKCFQTCRTIARCIGLTYRAKDKACFVFLNERLYWLPGWTEGGIVTGARPSELKKGRREPITFGLTSFIKTGGMSLGSAPYNEMEDMESSVAADVITQSPIPRVFSPREPVEAAAGTEGMSLPPPGTEDGQEEFEPPDIPTLAPLQNPVLTLPPIMKGPLQPEQETPVPLSESQTGAPTGAPAASK